MGKKTKYTPLDWTSFTDTASPRQFVNAGSKLPMMSLPAAEQLPQPLCPALQSVSASAVTHPTEPLPQHIQSDSDEHVENDHKPVSPSKPAEVFVADSAFKPHSSTAPKPSPPAPSSTRATPGSISELQECLGKLSLAARRDVSVPCLAETSATSRVATNQCSPVSTSPTGEVPVSRTSGLSLPCLPLSCPASLPGSSSPHAAHSRRSSDGTLYPRKPLQTQPVPGKVYFMPDGRHCMGSIIYNQKRQEGFFKHPMLAMDVEGDIVSFYAITKKPPRAIQELNMALRLGTSTYDAGWGVLKLAPSSACMKQESWINLEQRFYMEWKYLDEWAVDVQVDPVELGKIAGRVAQLEADQNRFIYKPLLRNMSMIQPGMVIMLPNGPVVSTLGAPILVIENKYPRFGFLRIKRFQDNSHFNPASNRPKCAQPAMCLEISRYMKPGHGGTPVLVLNLGSPEMRDRSYVEVQNQPQQGKVDDCKTWCWPPIQISMSSMATLCKYVADAAEIKAKQAMMYQSAQPAHRPELYQYEGPVQAPQTPMYGAYHQPHTAYVDNAYSQPYGSRQPPSSYMYQQPASPAYHPGYYTSNSGTHLLPHPGAGSRRYSE